MQKRITITTRIVNCLVQTGRLHLYKHNLSISIDGISSLIGLLLIGWRCRQVLRYHIIISSYRCQNKKLSCR